MNSIIKFFTSMKLAVVLLVVIITLCALATFVPQDKEDQYYLTNYSLAGPVILLFSFHHFFRSFLFFALVILFFVNLFSCTLLRILRRWKKGVPFRPGPDIIHIGLLLIIVGGSISLFKHQEDFIELAEGQSFKLPGGKLSLTLTEVSYYTYPDGRPKDWISSVEVFENGESREIRKIEVNSPLTLDNYKIYQFNYSVVPSVVLSYEGEESINLPLGQGIWFDEVGYLVQNIQNPAGGAPRVFFTLMEGEVSLREVRSPGESIGPFIVEEVTQYKKSGLQVTRDDGSMVIIIALILMVAGLFLTFYQKLGDFKE